MVKSAKLCDQIPNCREPAGEESGAHSIAPQDPGHVQLQPGLIGRLADVSSISEALFGVPPQISMWATATDH